MGQKSRVFIAEDHALVREGIHHFPEQQRILEVVGEVGDGEEAVRGALDLKPDVAIIDIAMPRLNGIDATGCIKRSRSSIAILVLTALTTMSIFSPFKSSSTRPPIMGQSPVHSYACQ